MTPYQLLKEYAISLGMLKAKAVQLKEAGVSPVYLEAAQTQMQALHLKAAKLLPPGYQLVSSSNLLAIGYFANEEMRSVLHDPRENIRNGSADGRLEVLFPAKAKSEPGQEAMPRWAYRFVPGYIVQQMLEAESIGSVFNAEVKAQPEAFQAEHVGMWMCPAEG